MATELEMDWRTSAKRYLERLGISEYKQQLAQHIKRGRKKSTFRYCPSDYHSQLIECLNDDSEERFKSLKRLEGYASTLKV